MISLLDNFNVRRRGRNLAIYSRLRKRQERQVVNGGGIRAASIGGGGLWRRSCGGVSLLTANHCIGNGWAKLCGICWKTACLSVRKSFQAADFTGIRAPLYL